MSKIIVVIFIFFNCQLTFAAERTVIKIGFGEFLPIFYHENDQYQGFGVELLALFNSIQDKYHFEATEIPSKRRSMAVDQNEITFMGNENIEFGWEHPKYEMSLPFYSTGDHFVALKKKGRDQSYFNDLSKKIIRLTLGYHYKFEREYAHKNIKLNIEYTSNMSGNLKSLIDNRADITVVPDLLIPIFCHENKIKIDQFLISKVKDNYYRMSFVGLKHQKNISIKYLNSLLSILENSGKLGKLRAKYHLNE